MNEDLTKDLISREWGLLNIHRRDAYTCHMDSVSNHAQRNANSDISVIPGELTGHLQPADVFWNKPFKQAHKALYNDWMASVEKSYTVVGNMCAPDKVPQVGHGNLEQRDKRLDPQVFSSLWHIC